MSINYDIWGAQSTWVDGDSDQQKANVKFAEASKDTYREQYQTGGIPLNDIDKSPAYWGIGKDSIWCKPQYLSPYQKDGETEVAVDPVFDNINSLPCIIMGYAGAGSQYIRYKERYAPMITEAPPLHAGYGGKIILDFAYKNIMLVPWIQCKATGWSSGVSSYSLYDYITNTRYNSLPEITGIGFQSFMGDGTANRSSSNIGICSPVDFKAYAVYHESTYFWAQQGCSQLLATTNLGNTGRCLIGETYTTTSTTINNYIGDSVTALAYKYSVAPTSNTDIKAYYFDPDNPIWKINKTTVRSGNTVWYEYPYIEVTSENVNTVKDYILSQIAYIGLPFVYNPGDANQGQIGDIGIYLPVFDDDGVTTGKYEEGVNALRLPNSEWTDAREGSGYDPNKRHDEDTGDDGVEVRPTTPAFTLAGRGTQCYAITPADMTEIFTDIYGRSEGSFEDLTQGLSLFGSDPMGAIISYKWYPFTFDSTTSASVVLGTTEINPAHTYPILQNVLNSVKTFSGKYRLDADRNFINSRATQARLYLPFYGFYELPMPQLISHELEIEFHYNVPDEVGTWIISWNNVIYDFLECDPAIEIPLTGNNARAIRSAKVGAAINIAAQAAMTAAVVAGGVAAFSTGIAAAAGGAAAAAPALGAEGAMAWGAQVGRAATMATNVKTASGLASTGLSTMNTINNAVANVNRLKVNVPFHPAADATTFLNLSMQPYIQLYTNQLIQGYSESEYKLKVGHACDKWVMTTSMPEDSLLKAGGVANMNTNGMEIEEVQELNTILQTGFYR